MAKAGVKGLSQFKKRSKSTMVAFDAGFIKMVKNLVKLINSTVIWKTPIKTGTARNSVSISFNQRTMEEPRIFKSVVGYTEKGNQRTQRAINRNERAINSWDIKDVLHISSNLYYYKFLNEKYALADAGKIAFNSTIRSQFNNLLAVLRLKWGK